MSIDPDFIPILREKIRKGDLKKIKIISAAIDCISKDGIEKTTFESIGHRSGTHKANVAYHFPDKEKIIEYSIQFITLKAQNEVVVYMKKCKKQRELLKYYIYGNYEWLKKYPSHASVMILFYYYTTFNTIYKKNNDDIFRSGIKRISEILKQSELKLPLVSIERISQQIQTLIIGDFISYITSDSLNSLSQQRAKTYESVSQIIKGSLIISKK